MERDHNIWNIGYHDRAPWSRWNTYDHGRAYADRLLHQPKAVEDWQDVCRVLHLCSSPRTKHLLLQTTPLATSQLENLLHHYKDLTVKHRQTLMERLFLHAYEYHDPTVIKLLKGYGLADHIYPWTHLHDLGAGYKHQWLSLARARLL